MSDSARIELNLALMNYQKAVMQREVAMVSLNTSLNDTLRKLKVALQGVFGIPAADIEVALQTCPFPNNPIGLCFYDMRFDHEHCIICRK